ncbi:hypothetical protein LSAT2_015399 [Lamellibrachia satsuma]|nr:hypothetical protein LSAT2_015399 [Lamellibrachia satsuma]
MLNQPTGVLAINTKCVRLISFDGTMVAKIQPRCVYVRIHAAEQTKHTIVYEKVRVPAKLLLDDLKHFHMQVNNSYSHSSNYIKFEIVTFDEETPLRHHILSARELHICDVIRKLYEITTFEMRGKKGIVGHIDVEICFSFGDYGYGCSNQLENPRKTPSIQVAHSMFCRMAPPLRRIDVANDVITSINVGHPTFINFRDKVDLAPAPDAGHTSEASACNWNMIDDPKAMLAKIGDKLSEMQQEYSHKPSRFARLQFLTRLITCDYTEREITNRDFKVSTQFRPLRHLYGAELPSAVGDTTKEDGIDETGERRHRHSLLRSWITPAEDRRHGSTLTHDTGGRESVRPWLATLFMRRFTSSSAKDSVEVVPSASLKVDTLGGHDIAATPTQAPSKERSSKRNIFGYKWPFAKDTNDVTPSV